MLPVIDVIAAARLAALNPSFFIETLVITGPYDGFGKARWPDRNG
jgi:hypothetical protein